MILYYIFLFIKISKNFNRFKKSLWNFDDGADLLSIGYDYDTFLTSKKGNSQIIKFSFRRIIMCIDSSESSSLMLDCTYDLLIH